MRAKRKIWTDGEMALLRERYPDTRTEELAAELGLTAGQVYNKAHALGLRKSPAFLTSEASGRITQDSHHGSRRTRFKKGQTPWNKGCKGLQIGGEATRFKKGTVPPNTRHDGAVSVRMSKGTPYVWERVAKGKWVMQHRLNWERAHGPLPRQAVLRCKDGDTCNTDPANWELIDRKGHMNRNSGAATLSDTYVAAIMTVRRPELREELLKHPEILELQRQNLLLRREIKRHEPRKKKKRKQIR
jgi:hypothetical protein